MLKTLRKFGLEYCDLPTMLWNISCMLRALSLNIDSMYKRRIPFFCYIFTIATAACYIYVYFVSTFWCVFWIYLKNGDVVKATILLALSSSSDMGTFKLLFMLFYEKSLTKLLDDYRMLDGSVDPNSRRGKNIKKTLRLVKKRALIFWFINIFNGVAYALKPVILPGRNLMEESQILYGLEPMIESPNYEINFVLMIGAITFVLYPVAHITALLIILTGYIEAQMLALKVDLLNIWDDAQENCKIYLKDLNHNENPNNVVRRKEEIINEYIKHKLEEIAKMHALNIVRIRQLEHIFRGAVVVEFFLLTFSFIAALLGGLENTYNIIPFTSTQVTMDCITGQRLIDACTEFENAVYNCKWENFDVSNRKTILMILRMSQKGMVLSAGGIATLNFQSLMAVTKIAYSAYTTLRSTMKV